jgi:uncharacterized metal-binding protein
LLHSDYHIVIDGCKDHCLTKTFQKAGIKVLLSYAMDEDFGLEKHPQPAKFRDEDLKKVLDKIVEDINELAIIRHPKEMSYDSKN